MEAMLGGPTRQGSAKSREEMRDFRRGCRIRAGSESRNAARVPRGTGQADGGACQPCVEKKRRAERTNHAMCLSPLAAASPPWCTMRACGQ